MAREVLSLLERAWTVEVGRLGFRAPLDDSGHCGPDGAFDTFLWRGSDGCYADVIAENPSTPYDDRFSYLVVDPWGEYGGPILDTTVAHELGHAMQASDDWSDVPMIYEATSVFVEDEVFDDDDQYVAQIADFQAHPDWSLDRDDGYATWSMYGAALYLRYLRDRHWGGDAAFIGELWLRLRSPERANEPDFEDALELMLRARSNVSFEASVIEFTRWRFYTGAHDDGRHLEEASSFAEPARAGRLRTSGGRTRIEPMALGAAFVDLVPPSTGSRRFVLSLEHADPSVRWVAQLIPGRGSDGEVLDLSSGPVALEFSETRTLALIALPQGASDPDRRTDARHPATVVVTPRP